LNEVCLIVIEWRINDPSKRDLLGRSIREQENGSPMERKCHVTRENSKQSVGPKPWYSLYSGRADSYRRKVKGLEALVEKEKCAPQGVRVLNSTIEGG